MGISGIRGFEDVERSALPDAAWTDNELGGNKEPFRTKHALFLRSVFMPTPAFVLDGVRLGVHEATSILRVHLCWVGHPS